MTFHLRPPVAKPSAMATLCNSARPEGPAIRRVLVGQVALRLDLTAPRPLGGRNVHPINDSLA